MKNFYLFFLVAVTNAANSQNIDIPDTQLKNWLLTCNVKNASGNEVVLNNNGNGEIELAEALIAYELILSDLQIQDLTGIENFTNLRRLDIWDIQATHFNATSLLNLEYLSFFDTPLSTLNVVGLSHLENLFVMRNQLQGLDLTGLVNLKYLYCFDNLLTSLDATPATNLLSIQCYRNQIANINVGGLSNLIALGCFDNQLASIEVSSLTNLEVLHCDRNQLTALDLTGLNLENLTCDTNQLSTLDVTGMSNLTILSCDGNNLITLYLKGIGYNGSEDDYLTFSGNPDLEMVCASPEKINMVQAIVDAYNYTGCSVSDCLLETHEFVYKGVFYYPNPTNDLLNYSITDFNELTAIQIFNDAGQLVKTVHNPAKISTLDVSDLPTGIYISVFSFGYESDTILKFIKI